MWIPWGKSEGAESVRDEKREGKKTMEILHCGGLLQTAEEIPRLSFTTILKV